MKLRYQLILFLALPQIITCHTKMPASSFITNETALSSPILGSQRFQKYARWIEHETKMGRTVSDRLIEFYNRINEHPTNYAVQRSLDFSAHERNLNKVESDLKANLKKMEKNMTSGRCSFSISQKDIGPNGFIITKPGHYYLKENIVFNPSADFIPAISIQSDNVTLDLNGKILSESSAGFAAFDNTSGIIIESGFNFVTIKNGTVTGFSNNGILAASANQAPTDHQGIIVKHIKATDCGKITTIEQTRVFNSRSGIGIDGATDVVIRDCCASNIASMIEADVISSYFSDNVLIKKSHGSKGSTIRTTGGDANGIIVGFFNNVIIECSTGKEISSFFPIGVIGIAGDTFIIRNCKGHNNDGALITNGISPQLVTNVIITDCEGNDNLVANTDSTQPSAFVMGIYIYASDTVLVKNSVAKNNALTANAIPVNPGTGATGIMVDLSNNILVEKCIAEENQVIAGVLAFSVSGFSVEDNCSNVEFKKCRAEKHSTMLGSLIAAGFLIGLPSSLAIVPPVPPIVPYTQEGIILDCCVAKRNDNTTNSTNGFGILFGIDTFPLTLINSSLINNTARCNNTGIRVTGLGTTGNLIENNKAINNTLFGILDTSCDNNIYKNNCSNNPLANGVCSSILCTSGPLTGNSNFCGLPVGHAP